MVGSSSTTRIDPRKASERAIRPIIGLAGGERIGLGPASGL
jgi:hypothetical protein